MWDFMLEYSFDSFRLKMYNDIKKTYQYAQLNKNIILIYCNNIEISISIEDAYEEYKLCENYNIILDIFLKNIGNYLNQYKFNLNYNKVYPIIKSENFGKDEEYNFLRENYLLDLDILYVQDMDETFRFLSVDDIDDFTYLKKRAFENLNKIRNIIVKLDEDLEIYSFNYLTDYSSSFFLLEEVRNQIIKKLGKKFLVAFSSSTSLIVAKDYPEYIDILKSLIDVDTDPHKVSEHIYKYNNGTMTFAETKNILKIIK
ncbi:hypothetical protein [Alkaliphilus sp. B6464]|uniref:hypothetical protein n=1 Tax=Alkaliphilus sp. B6464 TaxID=2731219 RepID=UPI001BAE36BC|nr:hypothetical protein [Alkaliphilus sp. B6464]QUH22090.1 hypothetical protein HYG84_19480 [Alkaliphilus sp. B6464]